MVYLSKIAAASDRVTAALVEGLEMEFGRGAGAALAARFLAAEEADFSWDARLEERWLGAYAGVEGDGLELDRIAVRGRLNGRWYVAQIIVDGDGCAHGTLGWREFGTAKAARKAFVDAH